MDGHYCKICKKIYSSYKSLWNHNKKYHSIVKHIVPHYSTILPQNSTILPQNSTVFSCDICNKSLSRKDSLKRHALICKNKIKNSSIEIIKKENEDIKNKNLELTNKFDQLLKLFKIHPKTLQKINKQLINNNTNNGSINNGTINNINIVKFGSEDISSILSQSEVLKMLNRKMSSIEESIKLIHFNEKRPQLKNIYITNLKDQYAYTFDGSKFIAGLKHDILDELVDNHIENIEMSIEEYKDKLTSKTREVLDKFIDKLNDDDEEFTDKEHNKKYSSYKNFKVNQVKLMIYNESENRPNIINLICERVNNENIIEV